MRRRPLLALLAGSVAAVTGCSGNSDDDSSPTQTEPRNGEPTPTRTETGNPESTPTETPDSTALEVTVEPLEYLVEAERPSQGITHDSLVPLGDVPRALRGPLEQARTGEYGTDEVSRAFLAAIDEFRTYNYSTEFEPYVRIDGSAYEFEPTVPTFVASLPGPTEETILEQTDPDRTFYWEVDQEFDSEAVKEFVDVVGWTGNPSNTRHEYRRSALPEPVEEFVSQYDYIEDNFGISELNTEWQNETPPYTLDVRELTPEMRWDRNVLDISAMEPGLRSTVRDVLDSDHRGPATKSRYHSIYVSDGLPAAFIDTFTETVRSDQGPLVHREDAVYQIRLEEITPDIVPVSLSSTVVADENGTESIEVTVAVEMDGPAAISEREVRIRSPGAVPTVFWVRTDEKRYLLDSDAYEDDMWESAPDDPTVDRRISTVQSEDITPDSPLAVEYEIPDGLPPGTYHSYGLFAVEWDVSGQLRDAKYPFRCTITIPER